MPEKKKGWFSDGLVQRKKTEIKVQQEPVHFSSPVQIQMPEGINFAELWKDEEEESSSLLQTIGTIANFVLLAIILILSIVK